MICPKVISRVCVIALVLAVSSRAVAQDDAAPPIEGTTEDTSPPTPAVDTAAEAQALFRRGLELGQQDRWAEALELFRRSRALVPRPSTLFNIGFALFRMGRFVLAIASFDEYLALTETETSDLRAEATRRREEARASLAALTLQLTPVTARLFVDGEASEETGSPRVLALDPGRHVLLATAQGHEEGRLEISVLAAEHVTRELALTEISEGAPPGGEGASLIEDPWLWVITGVLVVGAAVGVGVGVSLATSGPASYGGSTGVVLLAL
jgi:hypothetical protein